MNYDEIMERGIRTFPLRRSRSCAISSNASPATF
jgi:hypothetical protein